MFAKQIDVQVQETTLQELLTLVHEGTEIILTEGDKPVARLTPIETPVKKRRIPNLHPGGWISDDFRDPLPDEFWTGEDE
jgi:antitoxin (DNA-binding transcriptional repressor) of toxin-antitoxin stability system